MHVHGVRGVRALIEVFMLTLSTLNKVYVGKLFPSTMRFGA